MVYILSVDGHFPLGTPRWDPEPLVRPRMIQVACPRCDLEPRHHDLLRDEHGEEYSTPLANSQEQAGAGCLGSMESVWTAVPTEMLVLSPIFDRSNTPTGRAYSTRRRVYNCCNKAIERWWTRTCPTITHTELMKSVARAGMAGDSMGENTGRGGKRRANQARRKRKGAPQGVLVSYPRAVGRAGISLSSGVRCLIFVRDSSRHAERSDQRW